MSRRWRVIVVSILCAIVLIASVPWLLTALGDHLYAGGNHGGAQAAWRVASFTGFYERDSIIYDIGNAQYQAGDYQGAAGSYAHASAIASDKHACIIDYNWAMALSSQADQLQTTNASQALSTYGDAIRALSDPRCTNDPAYKNNYDQLRQDIQKKIADLTKKKSSNSKQQQASNGNQATQDRILNDHSQELAQQHSFQGNQNAYQSNNNSPNGGNDFEW